MVHAAVLCVLLIFQDPPRPAEPPAISASFKDGLYLKSADGNFDMTLGGHLMLHYRAILDRPDDAARTAPDTFFTRQARPDFYGSFYKEFEYKVMFDFATSASAAGLMDAYIGWKRWPEFSVRIGQFKQPFGLEETSRDSFFDFIERGVANRLVPSRDIGVLLHGKIEGGLLEFQAAVYNGSGRSAVDANEEKEACVRLRTSPFVSGGDALKSLRVGVAATAGENDNTAIAGAGGPLDFSSPELGILFLDSTTGTLDGRRTRIGVEVQWAAGPLSVRGEWIKRTDHVDIAALADEKLDMSGWTAAIVWVLTGEKKVNEGRLAPTSPITEGGCGAVELCLRMSQLDIDDDIFANGIAPAAGNSAKARGITAGVNWQLHRNVRLMIDVIMETYEDEVTFSNGDMDDSFTGVLFRSQLDF